MNKVSINVLCGNTDDKKLLMMELERACEHLIRAGRSFKDIGKIAKFKLTLEEVSNEKDTK